jgi:hypothetical protein
MTLTTARRVLFNAIDKAIDKLDALLIVVLRWLRALILLALVLAPIVIAFVIGVLVAVIVRMAIAAHEGFKSGQRLING